jgi:hypothetical protein
MSKRGNRTTKPEEGILTPWRFPRAFWLAALAVGLLPGAAAQATAGDSSQLTAELRQHYKLATAGLASDGAAGIRPGDIFTVRQQGIVGFADSDQDMEELCPTEYRGGALHPNTGALCNLSSRKTRRAFQVSDPICITSLTASAGNDSVSLYLIACDGGKKALVSHTYSAMLVVRFPKGFVHMANAARIEDTIGTILSSADAPEPAPQPEHSADPGAKGLADQPPSPEQDSRPEPGATPPSEQTDPPLAPLPSKTPAPSATPAPSGTPANDAPPDANQGKPAAQTDPAGQPSSSSGEVAKGQTPEQVRAILGAPSKIADLGAKVIYFYPQLKVVFTNGKVSEVQKLEPND